MAGLDLELYHEDVRRLALKAPAFRAAVANGCDPDDLLQQLYVSILHRNAGANPWDPARGRGLGGWVNEVVRSVVAHRLTQHQRDSDRERLVTPAGEGEGVEQALERLRAQQVPR